MHSTEVIIWIDTAFGDYEVTRKQVRTNYEKAVRPARKGASRFQSTSHRAMRSLSAHNQLAEILELELDG